MRPFALRMLVAAGVVAASLTIPAFGQGQPQAASPGPEFEVASVKPAAGGARRMMGGPGTNSPGEFSCAGANLRPGAEVEHGLVARPNDILIPIRKLEKTRVLWGFSGFFGEL